MRYTRLVGRTPLFGPPYRPCRLGPGTPKFCWLALVLAVLPLQIRMLDSCAQALVRSAAVCGERLVAAHPFFGVATEQALQATPCCAHTLLAGAGGTYACLIAGRKRWLGPVLCAVRRSLV